MIHIIINQKMSFGKKRRVPVDDKIYKEFAKAKSYALVDTVNHPNGSVEATEEVFNRKFKETP